MIARFDGDHLPKRIWTGPGCRARLGEALDRLAVGRVLAVANGSLLRETRLLDDVQMAAGDRIVGLVATGAHGATEAAMLDAAGQAVAADAQAVLSIGGGAAHDIAKAVALMARSGTDIAPFLAGSTTMLPLFEPLPLLAMPSTFSAAETVPGGAVILATGGKTIFGHPAMQPQYVFLDGEIVATTPRATLAASGLNAVHHCTEALYSIGRHPMSDAWATFALARLMRLLPRLAPGPGFASPHDCQMLVEASAMSGLAYGVSGLGVGHAICHSLAGRFAMSHGAANAVIVPHSAAFNKASAPEAFAHMEAAIRCNDLVAAISALGQAMGTPCTLRGIGLSRDSFDQIAADVLADPVTATNPRPVDRAAVHEILTAAW
jgi:alcohol dehydrogenase class IV